MSGGVPIHRYVALDEMQEGTWVAHEIMRLRGRGDAHLGDCAVMYRTNAQSRAIEDAFVREGIPYALIGGVRFYERREIKDVIAYLRLDRESGRRALACQDHERAAAQDWSQGSRGVTDTSRCPTV